MSSWYLVWILIVRTGYEFTLTPFERQVASSTSCTQAALVLEKQLMANPVEWADGYSFSIRCEPRK